MYTRDSLRSLAGDTASPTSRKSWSEAKGCGSDVSLWPLWASRLIVIVALASLTTATQESRAQASCNFDFHGFKDKKSFLEFDRELKTALRNNDAAMLA